MSFSLSVFRATMIGVIGGGIGGLAAAHYILKNKNINVAILEASKRVGGWIKSSASATGHLFEHGPRTIRTHGEGGVNTLLLVNDLGLSNKLVSLNANHPAAKNRMVYVNGKLYSLPSGFLSLFIPKPPFYKPLIFSVFKDFRAPQKIANDESIYSFVERRLGKEIADYIISPLICGICAGNSKEISVKFLMNHMFEAEQKYGSIVKGLVKSKSMFQVPANSSISENELCKRATQERWSVWSIDGGLEKLPKALEESVKQNNAKIQLNAACTEIFIDGDKEVTVLAGESTYKFKHIVCALPAFQLANLLRKQHPILSDELAAIPTVDVGLVNLQYDGNVLKHDAFGFLVPPSEKLPILGVIFDSVSFPRDKKTVLTVMMGGHCFQEHFGNNPSDSQLVETALSQVKSILDISQEPESVCTSVLRKCIPQYVVGHHDRLKRIREYISSNGLPLSLVGSSYDGVGVNDVILSSKKAVDEICGEH